MYKYRLKKLIEKKTKSNSKFHTDGKSVYFEDYKIENVDVKTFMIFEKIDNRHLSN